MNMIIGGQANGVAYSQATNFLYVPDPLDFIVTFLNATSLNYAIKASQASSIFVAPSSTVPNSVAVSGNTLIVTDTNLGSAYFLNASSGAIINPTGQGTNQYLPFVSASTPCTSASLVSRVVTNSQGLGYVLCGNSVIFLNVVASPNYSTSSLVGSTFTVPGATAPVDITYANTSKLVVVGGGSIVTTLNGASGTQVSSVDLSAYSCGGAPTISALTYASDKQKIIVADKANSLIYVLNTDLTLSTGSCGTSVFSVGLDVPSPDSLGYY